MYKNWKPPIVVNMHKKLKKMKIAAEAYRVAFVQRDLIAMMREKASPASFLCVKMLWTFSILFIVNMHKKWMPRKACKL